MVRTKVIRIVVIAVCAGGTAGMIVTSVTNHNGAAITFGLITAVAILCQMVATTVANEAGGWDSGRTATDDGAELEARVVELVSAGADESSVRDLVRHAVRLGRSRGSNAPTHTSDS